MPYPTREQITTIDGPPRLDLRVQPITRKYPKRHC